MTVKLQVRLGAAPQKGIDWVDMTLEAPLPLESASVIDQFEYGVLPLVLGAHRFGSANSQDLHCEIDLVCSDLCDRGHRSDSWKIEMPWGMERDALRKEVIGTGKLVRAAMTKAKAWERAELSKRLEALT